MRISNKSIILPQFLYMSNVYYQDSESLHDRVFLIVITVIVLSYISLNLTFTYTEYSNTEANICIVKLFIVSVQTL